MKFILIFVLSMLLTACSQQPSENDLKEAAKVSIKENNDEVKKLQNSLEQEKISEKEKDKQSDSEENIFGEALNDLGKAISKVQSAVKTTTKPAFDLMIFEFIDLQKLGDCEQQKESKKYKCTVKITVKNKVGTTTNTTDVMLIRSEGGKWVIID